jgi:hypothetical protein
VTLRVSNEFTAVEVRKVATRNGELLEIRSRKLGFVVRLDPLELEALTWQEPLTFSRLLETPYGPEDDTAARPLTDLMVLEASRPDSWRGAGS